MEPCFNLRFLPSKTRRRNQSRRRKVDPTITEAGMKQNYDFPAEGDGTSL
jgi:hypothetical protein